jgi:uncharacterized DUF497 family protein
MEFRRGRWNFDHVSEHGISPAEAEYLISSARPPYPIGIEQSKSLVVGKLLDGTYAQGIYVLDEDRTAFIIHARPLTESEKRRYRRRKR